MYNPFVVKFNHVAVSNKLFAEITGRALCGFDYYETYNYSYFPYLDKMGATIYSDNRRRYTWENETEDSFKSLLRAFMLNTHKECFEQDKADINEVMNHIEANFQFSCDDICHDESHRLSFTIHCGSIKDHDTCSVCLYKHMAIGYDILKWLEESNCNYVKFSDSVKITWHPN